MPSSTEKPRRIGRGEPIRWLAALGAALVAAGAVWFWAAPAPAPTVVTRSGTSLHSAGAHALPAFVTEPGVRLHPVATRPEDVRQPAAGRPTRIVIPALKVDVPAVPISSNAGVLVPPSDPQQVGWWDAGAVPGAATGRALITGHTVHTGGGAFDHLASLRPGDQVRVLTSRGTLNYTVSDVTTYHKNALARQAPQLFTQRGPGRLVLITCDDWNGHAYLSNTVVMADPD